MSYENISLKHRMYGHPAHKLAIIKGTEAGSNGIYTFTSEKRLQSDE